MPISPTPWTAEGRWPSATELDDYLPTLLLEDRPDRLAALDHLIALAQDGARCRDAEHHRHPEEIAHANRATIRAILEGHRLRLAWHSARRRAQRLASILNDSPPLTPVPYLVLDEDAETITWAHPSEEDASDLTPPQRLIRSARAQHRDTTTSWPCRPHPSLVHTDGPCPAQAQA